MKKVPTLFLKGALAVVGLAVLAFCVFALPAGIRSDNTGYYRPLLVGLYVPAIPFFIALNQARKLLKYIESNTAFSDLSVKALKNIKYSGIAISIMYTLGLPYIFIVAEKDDAPGVILMGLIIIFASFVIAIFAGLLQSLLQNAIDIKTENDLTV